MVTGKPFKRLFPVWLGNYGDLNSEGIVMMGENGFKIYLGIILKVGPVLEMTPRFLV